VLGKKRGAQAEVVGDELRIMPDDVLDKVEAALRNISADIVTNVRRLMCVCVWVCGWVGGCVHGLHVGAGATQATWRTPRLLPLAAHTAQFKPVSARAILHESAERLTDLLATAFEVRAGQLVRVGVCRVCGQRHARVSRTHTRAHTPGLLAQVKDRVKRIYEDDVAAWSDPDARKEVRVCARARALRAFMP
jgi:hypothetical protein